MYVRGPVRSMTCPMKDCYHRAYGVTYAGTALAGGAREMKKDYWNSVRFRLIQAITLVKGAATTRKDAAQKIMVKFDLDKPAMGFPRFTMMLDVSADMTSTAIVKLITDETRIRIEAAKKKGLHVRWSDLAEAPTTLWLTGRSRNRQCHEMESRIMETLPSTLQEAFVRDWTAHVWCVQAGMIDEYQARQDEESLRLPWGRTVIYESESERGVQPIDLLHPSSA